MDRVSWRRVFAFGVVCVTLAGALMASAQTTAPASTRSADSVRVYLVTIGPGAEVWEKFGHNMIWIHDPQARAGGVDAAYNWGLFNFEDHFILIFLANRMRYWMEAFDANGVVQDYIDHDRTTWLQELNLTDAQKEDLIRRVEINRFPANKYYNYDYYRDNCSTRVRDMLDAASGGEIRRALEPRETGTTYRWHTRRLLADDWFSDLGVQFLLGPPADQQINRWQEGFLPVKLMDHIREVQTPHGPLVISEQTLHTSGAFTERTAPPGRVIPYFFVGLLIAAAGVARAAQRAWVRGVALIVTFVWSIVGFIGGTLLLVLWLFTTHVPPVRNHDLLALNPLFGVLLITLPVLNKPRMCRLARDASAAIAVLSILALIVKAMPWSHQSNGDILAWAVTANLGMAAGIWLRCRQITSEKPAAKRANEQQSRRARRNHEIAT
jgi:hypothetical protein